jgi:uncharacterized protein with von Willebrand factor type A (vWA) domain
LKNDILEAKTIWPPEEIVAKISSELRKMGRNIAVEESIDAANALRLIERSDLELYEAAIKSTLIKDSYVTDGAGNIAPLVLERLTNSGSSDQKTGNEHLSSGPSESLDNNSTGESGFIKFGKYSPVGTKPIQKAIQISKNEEIRWLMAVNEFKNGLLTLEGHRFKKSNHGEINLRRTLRLEMKKAGDSPSVFHSMKKISKANVVLLCDVSGSMSNSNRDMVNFCCALKRTVPKSEIFLFSTKLKRITYFCSKYKPSELAHRIPKLDLGFGGGTKIGRCLEALNHYYANLLTRKTTMIIFSDGWDIGDISVLRREMKRIQDRVDSVIWVNPFLGSRDYSVETLGMKTALEYVDLFISPAKILNG